MKPPLDERTHAALLEAAGLLTLITRGMTPDNLGAQAAAAIDLIGTALQGRPSDELEREIIALRLARVSAARGGIAPTLVWLATVGGYDPASMTDAELLLALEDYTR